MKNISQSCPLCDGRNYKLLFANETFDLYRCKACHSNYQIRRGDVQKEYDESYFKENHTKAYGKTYLEDENNIRGISRRRLAIIRKLFPEAKSLLDAGSALGLFCDEARKARFLAKGAEISGYARNFSKEQFNIDCFPDFLSIREPFDCISLWFTLEHIPSPDLWLKKAYELLNPGGILAIAVPNGNGAFARFNPEGYFSRRPAEHYFEPSLKGMKDLLKNNGFTLKNTAVFGLHPERVGLPDWPIIRTIQKMICLGDTFEIYAKKTHTPRSNKQY